MFDNMRKINNLQDKLRQSQVANDALKKEIDTLKNQIENINKEQQSCTFIIDFDLITVFSMERTYKNNIPCTVFGYLTGTDAKEWVFYCNEEVHETLCFQFQEWKSKNVRNLGNV